MGLEEQYKQWLETYPRPSLRDIECAIIAENFAIGFAEWYHEEKEFGNLEYGRFSRKEILEIYKKTL